jgi:hypothetical protein
VGRIWGYYNVLEALDDPGEPSDEDLSEWLTGEGLDPKALGLDGINNRTDGVSADGDSPDWSGHVG